MNARRDSWKDRAKEGWAIAAVAVIAFVAGLLIGNLGVSPKSVTVQVPPSMHSGGAPPSMHSGGAMHEGGGMGGEPAQGRMMSSPGAQLFAGAGCGGCHTLAAAGSTGTTGPDLDEFLAPDDTTAGVEEMLVEPNVELAEGYPANVMPQDYGQTFSKAELHQLAEYLVATTPAKPDPSEGG